MPEGLPDSNSNGDSNSSSNNDSFRHCNKISFCMGNRFLSGPPGFSGLSGCAACPGLSSGQPLTEIIRDSKKDNINQIIVAIRIIVTCPAIIMIMAILTVSTLRQIILK